MSNPRGIVRQLDNAMNSPETYELETVRCDSLYIDGVLVTSSAAELNVMDGVTATAAELNASADLSAMLPSVAPGIGITAGTGTVIKRSLSYEGELKKLTIVIDLTGLGSSTTDLDVIGVAGGAAHLGQILAAEVGTVLTVSMTCLELPAGGVTDIDLYSATVGTAVFDDGIAALTETAIITAGGVWTNGAVKGGTIVPPANDYLYLTCGAAGVPGTYTAGKYLIEIIGV